MATKKSKKAAATKKPLGKKAATKKPATKKPATKKAVTKKAVTKKATAKEAPPAKKSATKKSATKKAATKTPATKKLVTKKTPTKTPTTKKIVAPKLAQQEKAIAATAADPSTLQERPAPDHFGTFEHLIATLPADVGQLLTELRRVVHEELPDVHEDVHPSWYVLSFRYRQPVCGVEFLGGRCVFYFSDGANLPDPDRILENASRGNLRYVRGPIDAPVLAAIRRMLGVVGNLARANGAVS